MHIASDKLQFAVRFVQMDLDRLRPGDWLNLREDLETFGYGTRAAETSPWGRALSDTVRIRSNNLMGPAFNEMTPKEIHELQAEVRAFFDGYLPRNQELREKTLLGEGDFTTQRIRWAFERRGLLTISGSVRDAVLLTLGLVLWALPPAPVLRCPECGALFYRVRKQQYCSRACVQRVSSRRWRQTAEGRQYEHQRSRRRYERKVKQQLSDKVQVGTRPRKGGEAT